MTPCLPLLIIIRFDLCSAEQLSQSRGKADVAGAIHGQPQAHIGFQRGWCWHRRCGQCGRRRAGCGEQPLASPHGSDTSPPEESLPWVPSAAIKYLEKSCLPRWVAMVIRLEQFQYEITEKGLTLYQLKPSCLSPSPRSAIPISK